MKGSVTGKPWILVQYLSDAGQSVKPGLGLRAKGFAVFPADNWRRYREALPSSQPILILPHENSGNEEADGFVNRQEYLRHLHVIGLTDFEFRQLCKTVLNVSPGVLQLRLGQMREDDRRPVAKYGVFPEYEFPATPGMVRG